MGLMENEESERSDYEVAVENEEGLTSPLIWSEAVENTVEGKGVSATWVE